jgi:hypothetical protein
VNRTLSAIATAVLLVSVAGAVPVAAQEDEFTRGNGLRDRFRIGAGAFFVTHDTFARLSPAGGNLPGVDIEADSAVPENQTDFRLDGHWRISRRHRLDFGYWAMNRGAVTRLSGEIEWDGETFPVDAEIATVWDTRILRTEYRFSVISRDDLDVGLSLGLFAVKVTSGIGLGNDQDNVTTDVSQTAPLPMLGAGVEWFFSRDFVFRASGQYLALSISDIFDGSWGELKAAVEWYPLQKAGIGVMYNFADIDLDLRNIGELLKKDFQYQYRFNGPQIYAVFSY